MARLRVPGCASWCGRSQAGAWDFQGRAPAAIALHAQRLAAPGGGGTQRRLVASFSPPTLPPRVPPSLPHSRGSCASGSVKPRRLPVPSTRAQSVIRSRCRPASISAERPLRSICVCLASVYTEAQFARSLSAARPERRQLPPPPPLPPPQPRQPEPRAPLKKQEAFFKTAGLRAASFVRVLSASPYPHAFCRNRPPPARPPRPLLMLGARLLSPKAAGSLHYCPKHVAVDRSDPSLPCLLGLGVTQRRPSPPRTFLSTSHPNYPTEGEIPEL